MTRMPWLYGLMAGLLTTACDRLAVAPGQDFGLTLLDGPTVTVVGKVAPVKLRFRVSGCDAFTVELQAGAVTRHQLDFARSVEPGAFEALAPVEWLREEDRSCLNDAEHPHSSRAQLNVTCLDADRTTTAEFTVAYGTATRALVPADDLRDTRLEAGAGPGFFFPGPDPLHPYWAEGPQRIYGWAAPGTMLVTSDSRAVESIGSLRSASGSWLMSGPTVSRMAIGISVPGDVVDLAFGPTGDLMVISTTSPLMVINSGSAERWVSRVPRDDEVPAGGNVQVLAHFDIRPHPGDWTSATGGFGRLPDGTLGFVTQQVHSVPGNNHDFPGSSEVTATALHLIRADAGIEEVPVALPAHAALGYNFGSGPGRWLALDGATALVNTAGVLLMGPFLGGPDGGWTRLARSVTCCDLGWNGVAWLDDAVAVWVGSADGAGTGGGLGSNLDRGWVDVFENSPGHARRFTYELHPQPGFAGFVNLRDVLATGNHLVLTTNSGVRILDRDGGVVGGSDPLPCGLSPTSVAAQVGPRTVGIGAGPYLYLFDF